MNNLIKIPTQRPRFKDWIYRIREFFKFRTPYQSLTQIHQNPLSMHLQSFILHYSCQHASVIISFSNDDRTQTINPSGMEGKSLRFSFLFPSLNPFPVDLIRSPLFPISAYIPWLVPSITKEKKNPRIDWKGKNFATKKIQSGLRIVGKAKKITRKTPNQILSMENS